MEIPARIVGHCTSTKAEVVSKDIPLLLSKKAMKDAKVNIDFVNDKVEIFGRDLDTHRDVRTHSRDVWTHRPWKQKWSFTFSEWYE